jgi:hypothetical protein
LYGALHRAGNQQLLVTDDESHAGHRVSIA